jgi:hypothetical protein
MSPKENRATGAWGGWVERIESRRGLPHLRRGGTQAAVQHGTGSLYSIETKFPGANAAK